MPRCFSLGLSQASLKTTQAILFRIALTLILGTQLWSCRLFSKRSASTQPARIELPEGGQFSLEISTTRGIPKAPTKWEISLVCSSGYKQKLTHDSTSEEGPKRPNICYYKLLSFHLLGETFIRRSIHYDWDQTGTSVEFRSRKNRSILTPKKLPKNITRTSEPELLSYQFHMKQ